MSIIKSLTCRRVLNSHVEFTNEFVVEFEDGAVGTGSSAQGETISIYEDNKVSIVPATIIEQNQERRMPWPVAYPGRFR